VDALLSGALCPDSARNSRPRFVRSYKWCLLIGFFSWTQETRRVDSPLPSADFYVSIPLPPSPVSVAENPTALALELQSAPFHRVLD